VYPSRGHWLPRGHPPTCRNELPVAFHCRFPRHPRLRRGGLVPLDSYGLPFHEPRLASRLPWAPDRRSAPYRQLHPPRSFAPPVSPFAPARVSPSWRPILSWSSRSLETLSNLGASTHSHPRTRGRRLRDIRDQQPLKPGEPSPSQKVPGRPRRQSPAPFGTGPHRLSPATPSPLTLSPQ
jgi:hypothetical protein